MKSKGLSLVFFLTIITASVHAQDYKNAIGVKFYPTGVTFKHFVNDKISLEAIGYFYKYGTRITGLYEFNFPLLETAGLNWYMGPGVHVGFYNNKYGADGATVFGIDGVIGLDFKIPSAPINLSLDWQPSLEFGDNYNNGFSGGWGGFGIRYTF